MFTDNPGKTDADKKAEEHENHDPTVMTTSSQEDVDGEKDEDGE